MRKTIFKKILTVLDQIELQGVTLHDTPLRVYEELVNDYAGYKLSQVKEGVDFLYEKQVLKEGKNGIDLNPAPTIYAKSNQNSSLEALSLMETFILEPSVYSFYKAQAVQNLPVTIEELQNRISSEIVHLFLQTELFEHTQNGVCFQPKLLSYIRDILNEYDTSTPPLISTTVTALFAASIVAHEDLRIDYKNTKLKMIDYQWKDTILNIIPRKGIPHDRDETKALQAFYKDTLFHEFDHACPLCAINIPHMLIASHIKPFRDCAHIYEAIDHNNGLLLCRNHDYLFDQGYFTFDENGYILLSKQLLEKEDLNTSYAIQKNYRLPEQYLTKERKLFLQYHKEHIFIDSLLFLKKKVK